MAAQPRLASTVLLLRENAGGQGMEVFMVRRSVHSEFVPDVYVFPGGSVSADDLATEQTEGICTPVSPAALAQSDPQGQTALGSGTRAAAIRELFEEANVLLAYRGNTLLAVNAELVERYAGYRQAFNERRGSLVEMARAERLVLATDQLVYFSHWITPEPMPKRYDTHFFVTKAPAEQEALYDDLETSDGVWIQPAVALERFAQEQFPIVFATYHQLRDLAAFHGVSEVLKAAARRHVQACEPIMELRDDKRYVYLPEDPAGYWTM